MGTARVSSATGLLDALASADDIEVDGSISGMPMISLLPGVGSVAVRTAGDLAGLDQISVTAPRGQAISRGPGS